MSVSRFNGLPGALRSPAEAEPFVSVSVSEDSPYPNPSSQQLRKLVLAYLCHHCYVSTAKVLAQSKGMDRQIDDAGTPSSSLDADGDELMDVGDASLIPAEPSSRATHSADLDEETLRIASLRAQVRDHILEGGIDAARKLLDATFPMVLNIPPKESRTKNGDVPSSNPSTPPRKSVSQKSVVGINESPISLDPRHLSLNLHIQEFIESMRTVPLSRTRRMSNTSAAPQATTPSVHSDPQRMLARAQNLSFLVSKLPSAADQAIYMAELQGVSALMAYHVPEASPVAKHMGMERRENLAEQINRAILFRTNQSPIPSLQRYAEHATVVWKVLNELRVPLPAPSAIPPDVADYVTTVSMKGDSTAPPFDFGDFVHSLP